MERRNGFGLELNSDQAEQHHETSRMLKKANSIADQLLARLRRSVFDDKEYARVCDELSDIAFWMNRLLESFEQIIDQRPESIVIHVRMICNACGSGVSTTKDGNTESSLQSLKPDPAWKAQIESLRLHTSCTDRRLFELACRFPNRIRPVRCLTRLAEAIRKQQRYLEQMAAGTPELVVEFGDRRCFKCGQPGSGVQ